MFQGKIEERSSTSTDLHGWVTVAKVRTFTISKTSWLGFLLIDAFTGTATIGAVATPGTIPIGVAKRQRLMIVRAFTGTATIGAVAIPRTVPI